MSCPSGSEGAGRKRILARGQCAALPPYAKNLANRGVGLEKIAVLLGHSSLNTTRIYITPDTKDLELAVEQLEQ